MSGVALSDLSGRAAIVTGGASGMGAACARLLAERGAAVTVVDRDGARAEEVAGSISGIAVVGDVSDSAFCDATVAAFDRLDILVNAAGVMVRAPGHDTSDDDWRAIFASNVDGVFFMSRAAVRLMRSQGSGSIVNFGSVVGSVGAEGQAAYAATKGAVHQLTRSMALEHATDGIRINAVCPGEIDTPMLASARPAPPSAADLQAIADANVPMKRLGEPEEVARVVVFLASDEASYMTGSMVAVDAGYLAR